MLQLLWVTSSGRVGINTQFPRAGLEITETSTAVMIVGTSPSAPSLYISTEGRISVGTPLAAFKFNITDGALCVDTYLNCETETDSVIGNGALEGADLWVEFSRAVPL